MPRHLLALTVCALIAATLPSPSEANTANDPAATLLRIHQLRLASQKSLAEYFMLAGMDGDQRYKKLMNSEVENAGGQLKALTSMPGPQSSALRLQAEQQWRNYATELAQLTETQSKQGFTDLQPVAQLANHNQAFNGLCDQLYEKVREEGKIQVLSLTEQSRSQSLLMQAMAVNYASRSASVGASFVADDGSDGQEQKPLDEMAEQFEKNLANMQQAPENTSVSRQTLADIEVKWRYIENSLKHYNEKSVPFLINKYADRITEELESLPAQYTTTAQL